MTAHWPRRSNQSTSTRAAGSLLLDDGDVRGEVVAQHRLHLVLELIEASDLASRECLGELRQILLAQLSAIGLGGEIVGDQRRRAIVGQIGKALAVLVEELHEAVVDRSLFT